MCCLCVAEDQLQCLVRCRRGYRDQHGVCTRASAISISFRWITDDAFLVDPPEHLLSNVLTATGWL